MVTPLSVLAMAASATGTGGSPPTPPTNVQLCAFAYPSPAEDRVRPLRVYTRQASKGGKVAVDVSACMVAPRHERADVTVQFMMLEARNHWWGDSGQSSCRKIGDMARAECHADRWVASAQVPFDPRPDIQTARAPKVLVVVNWRDCPGDAAPKCPGGVNRKEYYLLPTVELR